MRSAIAPAVRKVPTTPTTSTAPSARRRRDQPMCMPPSKRIAATAIVTIRSTV